MNIKLLVEIVNKGQFIRPILNYVVHYLESDRSDKNKSIVNYINVLKLKWDVKYNEALEIIDEELQKLKKGGLYYLILVEKIDILVNLSRNEEIKEVFNQLKEEFATLPKYLRGIVVENLKNARELIFEEKDLQTIRVWSESYENTPATKGFILLSKARGKKNEEQYNETVSLNVEAFKVLKTIPHPSGMVQALNNISWWLKNTSKEKALAFTVPLGFYLGYYFHDDNFKVFNSLDTMFQVQKNNNDPLVYETAFIFSKCLSQLNKAGSESIKNTFKDSINQLKYFVFNLDNNQHRNTPKLRDFIRKEIGKEKIPIDSMNIPESTLKEFLSEKTKYIQSNTLRNILDALEFEINTSTPICIIKELKKKDIDKKFEINLEKFKNLLKERQISELFTSYLVHYYKEEIDLKKIIKEIEDDSLIEERCDYYTKELINSIFERNPKIDFNSLLTNVQKPKIHTNKNITFNEHPFYLGRKEVVKRFMKDLNKKNLKEFIENYIGLDTRQKKTIEEFIMNYGRYYDLKDIPKEFAPKVPKEIDPFVKKYTLKRKPSAISFYVFEGEERGEFVEIIGNF
jgi:ribosomal protein L12E/L44/L45/RPP1/RPP2